MTGTLQLTITAGGSTALTNLDGTSNNRMVNAKLTGDCVDQDGNIVHDPDKVGASPPNPGSFDCNLLNASTLNFKIDSSLKNAKFVRDLGSKDYVPFCINESPKNKKCIFRGFTSDFSVDPKNDRLLTLNVGSIPSLKNYDHMINEHHFSINFFIKDVGFVSIDPMIPNKPRANFDLFIGILGLAAFFIGGGAIVRLFIKKGRSLDRSYLLTLVVASVLALLGAVVAVRFLIR